MEAEKGAEIKGIVPVLVFGFIIGVIQDSVETALNSSGDVIFCATAEFKEWQKQGKELPF